MRGRGLMLVAGARMGQRRAQMANEQAATAKAQGTQEAMQQQTSTAAPAQDVNAKLQKLAEFHKSGVLTDEEFAAAKKKLLGI